MMDEHWIAKGPLHSGAASIHIKGLSDEAICRECGLQEESFYHILCHCGVLMGHRMKTLGLCMVIAIRY
jgi:hypothetical protein